MREIIIALISSSITIVITSFFNYHFLIRKEIRMQANSYKVEILQKLYMPLMKEINKGYHPLDGYLGLNKKEFENVDNIIKNNYQFVSPNLALIHQILIEESYLWDVGYTRGFLDEDKYLLNHLEYNFNFYRKELGLPYNKEEMKRASKESKIKDGKIKGSIQVSTDEQ
ncbi:hypothetical protein [Planococcus halocryophilus]|uniref:hypothetical protein n=1 Tax=Planococcus halocryophilus TaxID=1215089 RepID=UPI001F0D12E4|nr:hypothetical protein [Planococcus halocryophilus]MCH4825777.1 hypothetical protein [Planococcus halocryophilus]